MQHLALIVQVASIQRRGQKSVVLVRLALTLLDLVLVVSHARRVLIVWPVVTFVGRVLSAVLQTLALLCALLVPQVFIQCFLRVGFIHHAKLVLLESFLFLVARHVCYVLQGRL